MEQIPQKELRNDIGRVLRRAESGETLAITVSGRAVAQLGPLGPSSWISAAAAAPIWDTPTPVGLEDDLEGIDSDLTDPYAR